MNSGGTVLPGLPGGGFSSPPLTVGDRLRIEQNAVWGEWSGREVVLQADLTGDFHPSSSTAVWEAKFVDYRPSDRPDEVVIVKAINKMAGLSRGSSSEDSGPRWVREAEAYTELRKWKTAANLRTRGLCFCFGVGESNRNGVSFAFFVLERLGSNLATSLNGLTSTQRTILVQAVLKHGVEALHTLSQVRVLHRDIHLRNFLLPWKWEWEYEIRPLVRLADFGIAATAEVVRRGYTDAKTHNASRFTPGDFCSVNGRETPTPADEIGALLVLCHGLASEDFGSPWLDTEGRAYTLWALQGWVRSREDKYCPGTPEGLVFAPGALGQGLARALHAYGPGSAPAYYDLDVGELCGGLRETGLFTGGDAAVTYFETFAAKPVYELPEPVPTVAPVQAGARSDFATDSAYVLYLNRRQEMGAVPTLVAGPEDLQVGVLSSGRHTPVEPAIGQRPSPTEGGDGRGPDDTDADTEEITKTIDWTPVAEGTRTVVRRPSVGPIAVFAGFLVLVYALGINDRLLAYFLPSIEIDPAIVPVVFADGLAGILAVIAVFGLVSHRRPGRSSTVTLYVAAPFSAIACTLWMCRLFFLFAGDQGTTMARAPLWGSIALSIVAGALTSFAPAFALLPGQPMSALSHRFHTRTSDV